MSARESAERAAELAAIIMRQHMRRVAAGDTGAVLPPAVIARHVCHLQRIARQLKAIAERQSNGYSDGRGGWDVEAEARDKKRETSLDGQGNKIVRELLGISGGAFGSGGDPRGPCAWLKINNVRGDGMDPDAGYAIY